MNTARSGRCPPGARLLVPNELLTIADAEGKVLAWSSAGRFEIVPGLDGRVSVLAQRLVPGVVRWYCDTAQRKVTARA